MADPTRSKPAKSWRKALLKAEATLQDAIRSLDESALQIVLIVTPEERLVGTLTDGDIRRGLLRGLELGSPIAPIIHREPLVVPPQLDHNAVLQLMQTNRLHQLPVIDEQRRVVGLHVWEDIVQPLKRTNPMVIMAGGRGSRLRPHTENCPKPMLPVGGKPMLEHILERARGEGICHFVFAIHYLGHMIEEHFGNGDKWGVRIDYVRETTPLGTAGAIGLIVPRPEAPFVVTNGDVLTDVRYGELLDFHSRNGAMATMAVRLHEWQHPFGVVRIKGGDIVGFEEKPVARSYINAGIYALDPRVLDCLKPAEACDMPTLFERAAQRGMRTVAYPMHEPWLDVGRIDDYTKAQVAVREGA
jgi:dTDP-glucose pyrophosphorylase